MQIDVFTPRLELIPYDEWIPIQGDLKERTPERIAKLVNSLEAKGGFVPTFIWRPTSSGPAWTAGLPYMIDGHTRKEVFTRNGVRFQHPDGTVSTSYPCLVIPAASMDDAIEKLLLVSSQYGRTTVNGFAGYVDGLSATFVDAVTQIDALDIPEQRAAFVEPTDDGYKEPKNLQVDIEPGDTIQIGPHRLVCALPTDGEAIDTALDGDRFETLYSDPSHALQGVADGTKQGFLTEVLGNCWQYGVAGAPAYWFFDHWQTALHADAFRAAGFYHSQMLIWPTKPQRRSKQDYQTSHQAILYGWIPGAAHRWLADRKQVTVLDHNSKIELAGYLLQNSTDQGGLVFDPFAGRGETFVAAHQAGLTCAALEDSPKRCQIIVDRMRRIDPMFEFRINGKPYTPTKAE